MDQNELNQNDARVLNSINSQVKLTEYCVYEHPLLPKRIVKKGFCWPALIVGPAYLIYRKLWGPLIVWFVALGLIRYFSVSLYSNYLNSGSDADTVELIYIGGLFLGLLILGSETNSLWKYNLMNRGYVKTNSLFARSMDAVLALIERERIAKQDSINRTDGAQVNDQNAQQSSVIENMTLGWRPSIGGQGQNVNPKSTATSPQKKKASWLRTILWMLSMMLLANVAMAVVAYFLFFRK